MLTSDALSACAGIRHGFMTRQGGVSEGPYASLNCGYSSDDIEDRVSENRRRAMARMGAAPDALVTTAQVHGSDVTRVTAGTGGRALPDKADGLVCRTPGIALGILTADCAPVLFADPKARVIGAAHAGWRGALAGILENTVAAMEAEGASRGDISAACGPCIAQKSYEVGPEFPAPFLAEDPDNSRFFAPAGRDGHFQFDLPAYVGKRLAAMGLKAVTLSDADTCAEVDRFFSYRRTTLRQEGDFGRGLSAIALAD